MRFTIQPTLTIAIDLIIFQHNVYYFVRVWTFSNNYSICYCSIKDSQSPLPFVWLNTDNHIPWQQPVLFYTYPYNLLGAYQE